MSGSKRHREDDTLNGGDLVAGKAGFMLLRLVNSLPVLAVPACRWCFLGVSHILMAPGWQHLPVSSITSATCSVCPSAASSAHPAGLSSALCELLQPLQQALLNVAQQLDPGLSEPLLLLLLCLAAAGPQPQCVSLLQGLCHCGRRCSSALPTAWPAECLLTTGTEPWGTTARWPSCTPPVPDSTPTKTACCRPGWSTTSWWPHRRPSSARWVEGSRPDTGQICQIRRLVTVQEPFLCKAGLTSEEVHATWPRGRAVWAGCGSVCACRSSGDKGRQLLAWVRA